MIRQAQLEVLREMHSKLIQLRDELLLVLESRQHLCEGCHRRLTSQIFDRRYLCDECRGRAERKLDAEAARK